MPAKLSSRFVLGSVRAQQRDNNIKGPNAILQAVGGRVLAPLYLHARAPAHTHSRAHTHSHYYGVISRANFPRSFTR